ncbi:MAG: hypothetical protein ACHQET_00680 [Chitinophagales bacterium]
MIKRIFGNLYFLTFLNGFLLATLFYFKMEGYYEQQLFSAIQSDVDSKIGKNSSKDSLIVKAMHECNALLNSRASVFGDQSLGGFKADVLKPTSIDLMTARGACGSYAIVLARLLQNYGYTVRIAQMKAKGVYALHNVVEAKTESKWIVLDPLFDVYFKKPDGTSLASFVDVSKNWAYYSQQLPSNYDLSYRYEDVRYTNWNKVPLIFPAFKKLLGIFIGKEADTFSMRVHFLKMYDWYFYGTLIIYIPILLLTLKKLIKTKIFPQPNIPLTFSNLVRYLRMRFENKDLKSGWQA